MYYTLFNPRGKQRNARGHRRIAFVRIFVAQRRSVHSFSFLRVFPVRVPARRFLVLQQICLFIGTYYYVKTRYIHARAGVSDVHLINYSLIRTRIIIRIIHDEKSSRRTSYTIQYLCFNGFLFCFK